MVWKAVCIWHIWGNKWVKGIQHRCCHSSVEMRNVLSFFPFRKKLGGYSCVSPHIISFRLCLGFLVWKTARSKKNWPSRVCFQCPCYVTVCLKCRFATLLPLWNLWEQVHLYDPVCAAELIFVFSWPVVQAVWNDSAPPEYKCYLPCDSEGWFHIVEYNCPGCCSTVTHKSLSFLVCHMWRRGFGLPFSQLSWLEMFLGCPTI